MYTIYEELGGNRHFYKDASTVKEVLEVAEEYWSSRPRVCRLVVSLPGGGEKWRQQNRKRAEKKRK